MKLRNQPAHDIPAEVNHRIPAQNQIERAEVVDQRRKRMLDQIVILKAYALSVLRIDDPAVSDSLKALALQLVRRGAKCPLLKIPGSRPAQERSVDVGADDTHIPTSETFRKFAS